MLQVWGKAVSPILAAYCSAVLEKQNLRMCWQEEDGTMGVFVWGTHGCSALCCSGRQKHCDAPGSLWCRRGWLQALGRGTQPCPGAKLSLQPQAVPLVAEDGQTSMMGRTHHSLPPLAPAQAHELLVLARDKVDSCVLQQGSEDKEQANGHPDVNSLHIGDL